MTYLSYFKKLDTLILKGLDFHIIISNEIRCNDPLRHEGQGFQLL